MQEVAPKGVVWLCPACTDQQLDTRWVFGLIAMDGICHRCGRLAMEVFDARCEDPQWVDQGPRTVFQTSTCSELAIPYRVVWDVNCYYRYLGVATNATRAEIRTSYVEQQGWLDERKTYIVKLLCNRERREVYDSIELGGLYFDEYIKRSIAAEIDRRNAELRASGQDLDTDWDAIDFDELINKPLAVHNRGKESSRGLDPEDSIGQDDGLPRVGYFLWGTRTRRTDQLAEWRALLSEALRPKGVRKIAVGIHSGHGGDEVVTPPAYLWLTVFFIQEGVQPTKELAEIAAARVEHRIPAMA